MYPIQFALMKDIITIYIDTSGENLYKRGYREQSVLAPMRETLAFSMIDLSFWRGDRFFLDPFCGSGTTCAVAKRLGLNYLGFEISPKWHQVAVDRLNGVTAKQRKAGVEQLKLF